MHRWLAMAALGAALLTTPVWGQRGGRGGMSMGGAGHVGFASHGGGGFSRGPVYGGGPHGGANWGAGSRGWSGGHSPNGGWGWRRPPYGHYPYRDWGRGYPWGYGYGGSWYPGWGWYGAAGWYGDSYSYPAQNYPAYVYASPDNSDAYAPNSQLQQMQPPPEKLSQRIADYPGFKNRNPFQTELKILGELFIEDVVRAPELEKEFLERCYCPNSPWCKSGFVRKKSEVSTDIVCRIALWRWARASSGRSKRGCGSRTQNWHRRRGIPSTRS